MRLTRVTPPEHLSPLPTPTLAFFLGVLHEDTVVLELREDRVHLLLRLGVPDVNGLRPGAGPNFPPFSVVDDQLVVCAGWFVGSSK